MILVTGATGKVGRPLVERLVSDGHKVRAMSRSVDRTDVPDGVDVVAADILDLDALADAADGADATFLLWPFSSPEHAARWAPGVVSTIAARSPRVVHLSAQAAEGRPQSFWAIVEREVEERAREWTQLRPVGFAGNTQMWADQIRAGDVVRWPFGAARRPLVDERDIADVAAAALTGDGHAGQRHVISGPELLRQDEQVALIGQALGRALRWQDLGRDEARELLRTALGGFSSPDAVLDGWESFIADPEPVTTTVTDITGAPPRSFATWARDHAHLFR
ncbi:NAD(P)H-binding protein [Mumia sp. zg.B53]|uniref:SDR family oxidoreductase n=1 Tax=unclassified Mumia TaxID=2621872 RepID=UPI001C6EBD67|nr:MULTISPECIES: NAD(P)H-binding protein [unclassified Mumia]MBW9208238.1 NAD(P)H-binding protein [Mumia sp. zg.B21]MBW9216194.1 NAD(P)H-binding protein [Mumia sp. zg.B53]